YNAKASGSKPAWSLLHDSNPEAGSNSRAVLSWPNRLSVLAMAYHYADEPKRAKLFIDQSIRDVNSSNQPDGVGTNSNNKLEKQALLFIVAASIYAKLSDFRNADNYLDHAFTLQFSLNESLAAPLLGLATIYGDSGYTDKAISILEKAIATIPSKDVLRLRTKFDTRLAELFRKNKQPDKALDLIQNVLGKSKDPAPREEHQMAAELFEQSKNYAEAATHYYEAGKWSGDISNQKREELLRKAIECASKTENFDKSILSKTYIALCGIVERTSLDEGLALREKAVSLLIDTDPEKAKQLSTIAFIKGELSKRNSSLKTDLPKSTQSDERLAIAKQAAELAAKNNSKEASDYWFRLAYAEAAENRIDAAVQHARKGIEAYQSANTKTHTLYQLLTSGLPLMIARAGSPEKAESLLKEAQARVQSVAGAGGLPVQVQMSHYFDFAFQQKDYAKADKLLDALLSTDLNQGRYSPPNHDVSICRFGGGPYPVESSMEVISKVLTTAKQSVVGKDNRHALRFLDKILTAETKQFGKDDYRLAITYAEIARVHSAAGDKEKAYAAYTSAIEIMHHYEDMLFVLSNVNPDYYNVLRTLNKQSEIEKTEEQKLDDQKNRQERLFERHPRSGRSK
ncbi:MAG: hypothetical protein K2X81_28830, partial [Candidatus Obscuribacterales bacterium]|nr:hypothetical protein [Candidatus Obscuribacterales bacterium]